MQTYFTEFSFIVRLNGLVINVSHHILTLPKFQLVEVPKFDLLADF